MSAATRPRRANGEGSVYFDAVSQRWVAALTGPDGRRHKRTAATRKLANARLHQLVEEQHQFGRIASPNATVGELLELWSTKVLDASDSAPSTRKTKRWALAQLHAEFATTRLSSLDADRIERGLAKMADDGLGRQSLIKVRSVLNQVCRFGERRDLLRKNPALVAELPAGLSDSGDGRAFNVEQARTLLAASHTDRLYALWCTMLMLGLRPGEALGLTWDAIDLDSGVLHVRNALRHGDNGLELTSELKTARSRRSLQMPPPLMAAFVERRQRQRLERDHACEGWSEDWPGLVFTTAAGTPIDPSNLRRHFAQLTSAAGLGRWTPNELRHTAVSILSASGLPLEHIADVVGHSGIRMTAKVYRHVLTPSIGHAAGPMNDLFGAPDRPETAAAGDAWRSAS